MFIQGVQHSQASGINTLFSTTRGVSLRFGWSAHKPPQHEMPLSENDFSNFEQLRPKSKWVNQVVDKLVATSSETQPRVAYVPQIKKCLKTWKRVQQFQKNLMQMIGQELRRRDPLLYGQPQFYPAQQKHLSPNDVEIGLSEERFDGINASRLDWDGTGEITKRYSTHAWHHDPAWNMIGSLSYGQPINIDGGNLQVMDARQLAQDRGYTLENIFNKKQLKEGQGADILPRFTEKARVPYTLTLSKDGLIIFNNMNNAGILHRPSPTKKANPHLSAKRPIYYVSYKVKAKA
jgi:hypothetical protein